MYISHLLHSWAKYVQFDIRCTNHIYTVIHVAHCLSSLSLFPSHTVQSAARLLPEQPEGEEENGREGSSKCTLPWKEVPLQQDVSHQTQENYIILLLYPSDKLLMVFDNVTSFWPSIGVQFKADRLNLRNDDRWSRLVAQTHEQRIIWADNVQKLNRSDGKVETENAVNCCDMWLPTDIGHVLLGQGCAMSLQLIPLPNNLAHIIPTTHTHTHTHMHTHTHTISPREYPWSW